MTSQKMIDSHNELSQDISNHIHKSAKESLEETESKGNNNFSNSLKTENNLKKSHNCSSLFQETNGEEEFICKNLHCEYQNKKISINLTLHNRTSNGKERTIFDDAEYFSKHYSYKLLPINFENINELLIHLEHNYSYSSLSSESEVEEDCSRTLEYNQVKEKNYKRRKGKFKDQSIKYLEEKKYSNESSSVGMVFTAANKKTTEQNNFHIGGSKCLSAVQPLDLSAPLVQDDEKTDGLLEVHANSNKNSCILEASIEDGKDISENLGDNKTKMNKIIDEEKQEQNIESVDHKIKEKEENELVHKEYKEPEEKMIEEYIQEDAEETIEKEIETQALENGEEKEDSMQFDSDKENRKTNKNLIKVTIIRGDGKSKYQPCDSFLHDIARLVPKIVEKNCNEIDIFDRTSDSFADHQKQRLYYIISESTWRLFKSANERVILTNDKTLGQPILKLEKDEKPSYLVFDQYSLAKCLADYCKEIGGCFEYKCVEEEDKEDFANFINTCEAKETKSDDESSKKFSDTIDKRMTASKEVPSEKCQLTIVSDTLKNNVGLTPNDAGDSPTFSKGDGCVREADIKVENQEKIVSTFPLNVNQTELADVSDVGENPEKIDDESREKLCLVSGEKTVQPDNENRDSPEKESQNEANDKNGVIEKVDKERKQNGEEWKEEKAGNGIKSFTAYKAEMSKKDEANTIRPKASEKGKRNCKSASSNAAIPAEGLELRRKRSSSKSDEKSIKKSKVDEYSSVRTRSQSSLETEIEKLKFDKSTTSQRSDNDDSIISFPKRIKRADSLSENASQLNAKNGTGKQSKVEENTPTVKEKKNKRTAKSAIVHRNQVVRNKKISSDNNTNKNIKKSKRNGRRETDHFNSKYNNSRTKVAKRNQAKNELKKLNDASKKGILRFTKSEVNKKVDGKVREPGAPGKETRGDNQRRTGRRQTTNVAEIKSVSQTLKRKSKVLLKKKVAVKEKQTKKSTKRMRR